MASFEERLEQVEHALARVGQMQEQGHARLEQALKRAEALIPAAGVAVAGAVQASADEIAKAHLEAMMGVVEEVVAASKGAVEEASAAIHELRRGTQMEAEAFRRSAAKEQQLEAALDALLPKVAAVQEGLEKKLGGMVNATAATEGEVRSMVGTMRASLTKEIETEVRGKLRQAVNDATSRVYGLAEWWERFTRVGIPALLLVFALVSGGLGWWFGQHQMKGEAREEALKDVVQSLTVRAMAYSVVVATDGGAKVDAKGIREPLVAMEDGSYRPMKRTPEGRWSWGKYTWSPDQVSPAMAWDAKTGTALKEDTPE